MPTAPCRTVRITVDVDPELYRALKIHAAHHDTTLSALLRQAAAHTLHSATTPAVPAPCNTHQQQPQEATA